MRARIPHRGIEGWKSGSAIRSRFNGSVGLQPGERGKTSRWEHHRFPDAEKYRDRNGLRLPINVCRQRDRVQEEDYAGMYPSP
jgi:hypothetical protein